MRVFIFRKDAGVKYPAKVSAKRLAPALAVLAATVRVARPGVVAHFLPDGKGRSKFARQAPVTRADLHHLADAQRAGVMTDRAKATLARGWEVPADELGRAPKNGERDYNSTAQSLLIFLKDRLGAITLAEADVLTVDPSGSDVSVIVVSD